MQTDGKLHRALLERIARRAMLQRGLLPDFSSEALAELDRIQSPAAINDDQLRDLTNLLWASIDNDDSRDLDQLTVAEAIQGDKVKILVAVADVDELVNNGSAIDKHARHNTTSVYTAARIFPMLPEKLSTDLTSLNFNEDRLAIVVEMVIGPDGSLEICDIYRARVRNHAKLAYNSVAAWLEGHGILPEAVAAVKGLEENLRLQDKAAVSMKNLRHVNGALSFETLEARPVFDGDEIRDLELEKRNRAKDIIEDFMVGANGVTARYLSSKKFSSIRRVVRTPKRWERIVELANEHGFELPNKPDSRALEEFLTKAKTADPVRFPDLSLVVIKLMGAGEYVAALPGETAPGHFGLAVRDYTHSTAPNRRYPDLITQRLLKAAIGDNPLPYSNDELEVLAKHCTEEEDAANKVERQVRKSAAAMLLEHRIGEQFDAIVTGAAAKGTWARLLTIPVEGRVVHGFEGLDVGNRIRVQLTFVDVDRGYIDFRKVGRSKRH
ncbi:MAG: RNB domain-containing ribonuclease [Dissulfurispiraceae bacterium]